MSKIANHQIYIDGVSSITLSDGMIRFEMVQMDIRGDKSDSNLIPVQQVVMSPNGFLRMFSGFQDFMERLQEAGLLKQDATDSMNNSN